LIKRILDHITYGLNKTIFAWLNARLISIDYFKRLKRRASGIADDTWDIEPFFQLKNGFPVNALVCNCESLWPGLRFWIWRVYRGRRFGNKNAKLAPLKLQLPAYWRDYHIKTGIACEPSALPENPVDFLFFVNQNGVEQTAVPDGLYNRISDPVFEAAQKIGAAQKIEIIKNSAMLNRKRIHPVTFVVAPNIRPVGYIHELEFKDEFIRWGRQKTQITTFAADLSAFLDHYFFSKRVYGDILDKTKPAVIFCMGFEFHQELFSAAHDRGIVAVDLQHGNQTGWGPLYKWWEEMPEEGYAALPDYFWVWGQRDFDHLSGSIPSSAHKPIIGGYPWLERQRDFSSGLSTRIKKRTVGKRIFLISMQNQPVIPQLFKQMINYKPDESLWLIRRHPKLKCNFGSVAGRENVLVGDDVDKAMLVDLIDICDAHVTGSSSVVIEAAALGKPSLVVDPDGVANFEDLFSSGVARHIANFEQFVEWQENRFSAPHDAGGQGSLSTAGLLDEATRQHVAQSNEAITRTALAELLRKARPGQTEKKSSAPDRASPRGV